MCIGTAHGWVGKMSRGRSTSELRHWYTSAASTNGLIVDPAMIDPATGWIDWTGPYDDTSRAAVARRRADRLYQPGVLPQLTNFGRITIHNMPPGAVVGLTSLQDDVENSPGYIVQHRNVLQFALARLRVEYAAAVRMRPTDGTSAPTNSTISGMPGCCGRWTFATS